MDTTFLREISLLVRSPKKGIDEIFWFGTLEKGIKAGLAGWCATHSIWHIFYIERDFRPWNILVCR